MFWFTCLNTKTKYNHFIHILYFIIINYFLQYNGTLSLKIYSFLFLVIFLFAIMCVIITLNTCLSNIDNKSTEILTMTDLHKSRKSLHYKIKFNIVQVHKTVCAYINIVGSKMIVNVKTVRLCSNTSDSDCPWFTIVILIL